MREAAHTITRPQVVRVARRWLGTPYHHQASIKQIGTDCLGLVRGVYREIYGEEAERPPSYTPDWAEAAGHETLLLAAARHLNRSHSNEPEPGDVIVFRLRSGLVAKHAAIASLDSHMIHAIEGAPVSEVHLGSWWRRRIAGVFSFPGLSQT